MQFIHLNCRSHYSFLDSTMSPEEIVNKAASLGHKAVAITDTANLCGMLQFKAAAKDAGIKAIYGVQLWIGEEERTKEPEQLGLFAKEQTNEAERMIWPSYKIILLIKNKDGFLNVCKMVSIAHKQRCYAPTLSIDQINPDGLICIASMEHGPTAEQLQLIQEKFGKDAFLEIYDHGEHEDFEKIQKTVSKSKKIQIVATNNCAYVEPAKSPLLSAMRSIRSGYPMTDPRAPIAHQTDQAWMKSIEEMPPTVTRFSVAVENTIKIAEACNFDPETGKTLLPNTVPPKGEREEMWDWLLNAFPPPRIFEGKDTSEPDETTGSDIVESYFAWYCKTGLEVRLEEDALQYGSREEYRTRLQTEIDIILEMGFPAYHLIVTEFINWAKDNGIPVGPGRGSAAGAVVCWAMRITDVNPLQFNLMFERYLNPERISMPDIDVDFAQDGREQVINHVRKKYGDECVCQILTVGRMKAKAALKDCARVIGVGFTEANLWSDYIEDGPKASLGTALENSSALKALRASDPKFSHAISLALELEGKPRQTGVHAAGVIITSDPISDLIPCHAYKDKASDTWKTTTGLEMGPSESMGLVKFDFLGLKTLDIIKTTLDSVEERTGQRPDLPQTKFDDPAVFDLLAKGDSLGLFQVESKGMQALLRDMKTDSMEDIVAISALYRPGPLGSGMVTQYVEVKHGREEAQYPHPLLERVLETTHGVFVFQEQVMAAAQVLAGFTLGQADMLRRAMGKKKQKEMDKQRKKFIEGCKEENDIDPEESERIFNLIDHFAGYGFNRSHSASYGVITYQTAWLKAHFRADLMAAAMTLEAANREKLSSYIIDCKQADIPVLRPDINRSIDRFSVEEHPRNIAQFAIRYGLASIKGVAGQALEKILSERSESGEYKTLEEFIKRTQCNRRTLVALICAGAMDEIVSSRFSAIESVRGKEKDNKEAPLSLWKGEEEEEAEEPIAAWSFEERLKQEHTVLGCWITAHPLDRFKDIESRMKTQETTDVPGLKRGQSALIAGTIVDVHRKKSRRGDEMAFFTISDRQGNCRVVIPDTYYGQYKRSIKKGKCVIIRGTKDRDGHEGTLRIHSVQTMETKRRQVTELLQLELSSAELNDSTLQHIKSILMECRVPKSDENYRMYPKVKFIVHVSEEASMEIWPNESRYDVNQDTYDKIEQITGREDALSSPS